MNNAQPLMQLQTGIRDRWALYSTKEYKKVRVRYFTCEEEEWERKHL